MSKSALQDFIDEMDKAAAEDNIEKEVKDTENATGDLEDDSKTAPSDGERTAENEAGMKAMHPQMVDNTEMGATQGEKTAPDGTNAKGTGEDPANENPKYVDNNDGNPPMVTDVEKRVMKEGAVKVAAELAEATLKYASELVDEMAKLAEEQVAAAAADIDLRKVAALEEELGMVDALAVDAASVYKQAMDAEMLAAEEAQMEAPVSDEEAVALAEALAEENLTPEELMALAEAEAQDAEAPIEEKMAALQDIGAFLGRVSQINNLKAVGRWDNTKKASIRMCSKWLDVVRGLKAAK